MRLIVFDMDGTLIDTEAMIAEQMSAAFVGAGLAAPDPEASRSVIGLALPVAIGRLAGSDDAGLIERLIDSYKTSYRRSLLNSADREPLYPGAREVLDRLNATPGTVLGIATGKGMPGVERILDLHGLRAHFVTVQTPDHNPSKPHPGMLLRAMAETGATTAQTVMIGDTTFDMETARAAGVAGIGVAWGYHHHGDLRRAGARAIVDRYDALEAAIDTILE